MTASLARYPAASRIVPRALIEQLSPRATIVRSKAGRTLVALGGESTNVYVVLEGRVQVTLAAPDGSEVVLRDLLAGELFGELAAVDGAPRSASIVALGDCVLASIPGAAFREAACATPEAALWLVRRLAVQIRELTEKLFEITTLHVPARLHCELLRLCVAEEGTDVALIDPAPTHAEFAARIGTHREAVTRELRYLGGRGVVAQARRRLTVLDLPELRRLVHRAKGDVGAAGQIAAAAAPPAV